MTGVPESVRTMNQMALKNNMRIVVLDGDIPAPNGSGFIDPLDIRPKVINWDVTTGTLPATAKTGDVLEVTVGGTYLTVQYLVGDGAYVLNKTAGTVLPLPKTIAVGGGSGTPISGAVWVKNVVKGPGALNGSMLTVSQQTVGNYGIKQLAGDELSLTLTIGALPGAVHTNDTGIVVYAVPGPFTPTQSVPYPAGTGSNATFATIDGNDADLDNLQFTANLAVNFSTFNEAQIVVKHSAGAYNLIRYVKQALPLLQEFDVTSTYLTNQTAGPMTYDRTAFKSGDTINFSFKAGAPITEIVVWPWDTVYNSITGPSGTPITIPVTGSMVLGQFVGTGSFVIPPTIQTNEALTGVTNRKLYAAASVSGQYSAAIQSLNGHNYSNQLPHFNLDYYAVNVASPTVIAIKASEEARISGDHLLEPLVSALSCDFGGSGYIEQALPIGVNYYDKRIHTGEWRIKRSAIAFNGLVTFTVTAYNFANGLTTQEIQRIHIENTTFNEPVILINNGNPIATSPTPLVVPVKVTCEVNCGGQINNANLSVTSFVIPQMTHSAMASTGPDIIGYEFSGTATIQDNAVRGTYVDAVTDVQLRTNAGTNTDFTGTFKISGFVERQLNFTGGAGGRYVPLVNPTIDHFPNVVVRDLALNVVSQTLYTYDQPNNRLVFDVNYAASYNSTGNAYVFVSQTPAP